MSPTAVGDEPVARIRDDLEITRDPARMDLGRVHLWLSEQSYWAAGRSREAVERSVAGSCPYAVVGPQGQVAFARVVTDEVTFAWICDVFVDPDHRGRGLGTWLVDAIRDDLTRDGVYRLLLATRDAHEVYGRLGFTELRDSALLMELDLRTR